MADQPTVQGPWPGSLWPAGRFKRMWMEFEVEVVDEDALRAFDLHPTADENGELTGVLDMDVNERAAFVIGRVMIEAMQAAEGMTGVRWRSGRPQVRVVDETGNYQEMTSPAMAQRRDDGEYDEDAFPQ